MRRIIIGSCCLLALLTSGLATFVTKSSAEDSPAAGRKPQDVYTLGTEAKLGVVTFSHINHITKNRNLSGTAPMACIECHHTAQPASEVLKHPPLKTAWPADRTSTLTADLFEKDPKAPEMVVCRDCHSRTDTKPKLLAELPQIKLEEGTALITLNNQQAYHRNCGGCHDEIVKTRTDVSPPTSKKCMACHKKAAAERFPIIRPNAGALCESFPTLRKTAQGSTSRAPLGGRETGPNVGLSRNASRHSHCA